MKKILLALFILLTITLIACGPKQEYLIPELYYDTSFPKNNKNLSGILGEKLILKSPEGDTLTLSIISSDNSNLILDTKTSDTLFNGKVSKSKGLYYFSEEYAPGKFNISAAKIRRDKLYGLLTSWYQQYDIYENADSIEFKKLLKAETESAIILHPEKATMKKLYSSLLNTMPPFIIIQSNKRNNIILAESTETKLTNSISTKTTSYFTFTAYPNPVTDYLNLEFDDEGQYEYKVFDLNGACTLKGHLSTDEYQLDLRTIGQGNYILALTDQATSRTTKVRIIKN